MHVRIKGQNLNFYLETQTTSDNIWSDTQYNVLDCSHVHISTLIRARFGHLSGVYTTNLLNNLVFYLGQILSLYEAKTLGKYLAKIFSFIKGQYFAQIKIQIVKQIGCVDAALSGNSLNL